MIPTLSSQLLPTLFFPSSPFPFTLLPPLHPSPPILPTYLLHFPYPTLLSPPLPSHPIPSPPLTPLPSPTRSPVLPYPSFPQPTSLASPTLLYPPLLYPTLLSSPLCYATLSSPPLRYLRCLSVSLSICAHTLTGLAGRKTDSYIYSAHVLVDRQTVGRTD